MLTREQYEEKRQARYDRLIEAARKAQNEGGHLVATAKEMADVIPFGQPILVGHHSEGRDRRYRNRIENKFRKGYELYQKAEYYSQRAESVQACNAIFSDDPDAVEKLEEKIARLEKRQEMMKAANKLIRKNDREGLLSMGFTEEQITKLFTPDFVGRVGFPDYELQNNGANIRRLKDRVKVVEKKQAMEDVTRQVGPIKIEYSPSENRIRIYYPGKPDQSTRDALKANGYRWAPSFGAWSGFYNWRCKQFADSITE